MAEVNEKIKVSTIDGWYSVVAEKYLKLRTNDVSRYNKDIAVDVPPSSTTDKTKTELTYNSINTLIDNINRLYYPASTSEPSSLKVYFAYVDWTQPPKKDSVVGEKIPISKKQNLDYMAEELKKICPDNSHGSHIIDNKASNGTKTYATYYDITTSNITRGNSDYGYSTDVTYKDNTYEYSTYTDLTITYGVSTCTECERQTNQTKSDKTDSTCTTYNNVNCEQYAAGTTNCIYCKDDGNVAGNSKSRTDSKKCGNYSAGLNTESSFSKTYTGRSSCKTNSTCTTTKNTTYNSTITHNVESNSTQTDQTRTDLTIYCLTQSYYTLNDIYGGVYYSTYTDKTTADSISCSESGNTTTTNATTRYEYVVKNGQKLSCENYDYKYIPEN